MWEHYGVVRYNELSVGIVLFDVLNGKSGPCELDNLAHCQGPARKPDMEVGSI
jgi:hypothetical protein